MTSWSNKVALVTGGSSGLGRAIATAFVQTGVKVAIAAHGAEKLKAAAADLRREEGGNVLAVQADVTRQADVEAMVSTVVQHFGRLDVLVNNAGRSARGEVLATTPEEFQELMDLNLIALVRCTRAAAPHLLKTGGHIVNIGSLAAKSAARYLGAYPATKFAVAAYSQQLRLELEPQGLHVLLVCPGPIARDERREYPAEKLEGLPAGARQPGGGVRVGALSPERLAEAIVSACQRRQAELVIPGKARVLFAISQLSPRLGDWLLRKMTG